MSAELIAEAEQAFIDWVIENGGDPVKDAKKVYLQNLRDAFYAGYRSGGEGQ